MNVKVIVTGVKNSTGQVRGLAFSKAKGGFPDCIPKAEDMAETKAVKGKVILNFNSLSSSEVAFSIFHDEDGNGKIKKNFLGIPKDGVGASNWSGWGRPSFEKSLTKVKDGITITVKLNYL